MKNLPDNSVCKTNVLRELMAKWIATGKSYNDLSVACVAGGISLAGALAAEPLAPRGRSPRGIPACLISYGF